jgi:LuxR family quorum-sensing system transcriptional regulator CciR
MAIRLGTQFPEASLPSAQYIASFAFEAARRVVKLNRSPDSFSDGPTRLTQRQLDCLVLVGRGKSDWDISQLLGISDQTVHQHVEAAKKRFGVASRTQMVVRALFESQLTFSDLFG